MISLSEYDKNLGGEWPLTNREILIIRSNYDALTDLMKSHDLMDLLYETGVINRKQREFICSQFKLREKNETLLQILKSCTLNSYWQTIRCLHQKNQSNIAKILETGGSKRFFFTHKYVHKPYTVAYSNYHVKYVVV